MRYWLFKSEPSDWSWQDQQAKAPEAEEWTGVRNYQARNIMRDMDVGDRGFFYHSQKDRAVVGIVDITGSAHPDSTDDTGRWECVDIRALKSLTQPVSLDQIKSDPRLADMALVRSPRLSVQPVSAEAWQIICAMGQTDPD